jgi:hypothetical protein
MRRPVDETRAFVRLDDFPEFCVVAGKVVFGMVEGHDELAVLDPRLEIRIEEGAPKADVPIQLGGIHHNAAVLLGTLIDKFAPLRIQEATDAVGVLNRSEDAGTCQFLHQIVSVGMRFG